jgi:signal transduction histidine kinase
MKSREEWADIKTVIKRDLNFYGIGLDFEFDIIKVSDDVSLKPTKNTYLSENLEEMLEKTGYKLSLKFPEKRDFIIAQIGDIFIFSIILLLLVSLSFILIYNYYRKEKILSESILDFVNNVTHEFKTPLTNISLANSMLSKNEKVEKDDKLSFYSRIIRTEQIKLNEKVEQLLKTNFTDLDKPQHNEEIDAASVSENIIETYRVQIEDKGGSISLIKNGADFIVSGNLDMLHIAIGNLIDNAIKYSTNVPQIFITLTQSHNQLVIEIEDNGPGISKEFRERVFEKYFRVPTGNVHNIDGFGLGLFQVKNIFAKMKGSIRLTNRKEGGLRVTVELPLIVHNG